MIKLKKNRVLKDFDYLKKIAQYQYEKANYENVLDIINVAAQIAYHLNFCYSDSFLESLLQKTSTSIYPNFKKKTSIDNRYVFYDCFGWDNKGLTQQYIRYLISKKYDFLYILETPIKDGSSDDIIQELEAYSGASIYYLDNKQSKEDQIKCLVEVINHYQPQKAFLHLAPWSTVAVCIWTLLSHIERYQINLTDHAFWLGTACFDFCLEFRDYGYNISKKHRNIKEEKLLLQPYYPILNKKTSFQGYPTDFIRDKIIIISGATFYKVYGEADMFFKLLKRIFDEIPNSILLFAGSGDVNLFNQLLSKYEIQDKVFLLGNRKDIAEVIANGDIYLGTYPIAGGLMSQLGGVFGKPIIAYSDKNLRMNEVESLFLPLPQGIRLTYNSEIDFISAFHQLVNDKEYRDKLSKILQDSVISFSEFNISLDYLIESKKNTQTIKDFGIDTDRVFSLYLNAENNYIRQYDRILCSYRSIYWKSEKYFTLRVFFYFCINNYKRIISKIKKYK